MSSISKETLEHYLELRLDDTRDNWRGLCPFHYESTASFFIHKEDLVGHCFGCGIAGRIDVLVAKKQEISSRKARELLGVNLLDWAPLEKKEKEVEPTYPHSWIRAWRRIKNHPYLERRGFTSGTIEQFEMRWDPVTKRVVWPLVLPTGRTLGAVGRSTTGRDPKYLFYWNCDKGDSVWTAPSFWSSPGESAIVVEGILDCMYLWQHGYRTAVSLIGASATQRQIRQLKQFDHVIIAFDNDKAGRIGGDVLGNALKATCSIEYALYPEYASDANDLSHDELVDVFEHTVTPLQKKLHDQAFPK